MDGETGLSLPSWETAVSTYHKKEHLSLEPG